MKNFYSYPDMVQTKIRKNSNLSKMIPVKSSYLKSFLCNLILFTIIFIMIGFMLRISEFIYFLVLGEGLNLFDFLIIDCCWWSKTKRTRFTDIIDDNDYRGIRKHWESFIRGIPVMACAAIIATGVIRCII